MRYDSKVTVGLAIGLMALIMGAVKLVAIQHNRNVARFTARQEVVCPSFLSIARSARDTLIVMRNEPLCNRYVLDNLK